MIIILFSQSNSIDLTISKSRGGAVNSHPGNRRFRKFIQEFKYQYLNEEKQRKPAVAMRVLEAVKPGRYVKLKIHVQILVASLCILTRALSLLHS